MTGTPVAVAESGRPAISAAHRRMLVSCFLGTTIEWYDFLVYGFLTPVAFNALFFPSLSPLAGTIAGFGVFAVGFAARPIGGVFFAHFGDRVGRKPIMVSTLILMGASTTLMGLTPTFAQIGIAAPLVLVTLRFLQGFSLGGESAAGPLLAMESAPGNRRGLFAALVSAGAAAGTVLGALAVFAVGALPREDLLSWGWRLPFIASAPIFAISFYVRMKVEESPIFQRAVERAAPERVPLFAVLERYKVATLQVLLCAMAESSTFYFTSIFGLSYGIQTLKLGNSLLLSGVAIGNAIGIITNPLFGALSDRIGRRPLLLAVVLPRRALRPLPVLSAPPYRRHGHRHSRHGHPGRDSAANVAGGQRQLLPGAVRRCEVAAVGRVARASARHDPRRRPDADDRRVAAGVVRRIADLGAGLLRADLRDGRGRRHLRARDSESKPGVPGRYNSASMIGRLMDSHRSDCSKSMRVAPRNSTTVATMYA